MNNWLPEIPREGTVRSIAVNLGGRERLRWRVTVWALSQAGLGETFRLVVADYCELRSAMKMRTPEAQP